MLALAQQGGGQMSPDRGIGNNQQLPFVSHYDVVESQQQQEHLQHHQEQLQQQQHQHQEHLQQQQQHHLLQQHLQQQMLLQQPPPPPSSNTHRTNDPLSVPSDNESDGKSINTVDLEQDVLQQGNTSAPDVSIIHPIHSQVAEDDVDEDEVQTDEAAGRLAQLSEQVEQMMVSCGVQSTEGVSLGLDETTARSPSSGSSRKKFW